MANGPKFISNRCVRVACLWASIKTTQGLRGVGACRHQQRSAAMASKQTKTRSGGSPLHPGLSGGLGSVGSAAKAAADTTAVTKGDVCATLCVKLAALQQESVAPQQESKQCKDTTVTELRELLGAPLVISDLSHRCVGFVCAWASIKQQRNAAMAARTRSYGSPYTQLCGGMGSVQLAPREVW